MVTILGQKHFIWKQIKLFDIEMLLLQEKYQNWNNMDYPTYWVKGSHLNVYQSWSTSSLLFLLSS